MNVSRRRLKAKCSIDAKRPNLPRQAGAGVAEGGAGSNRDKRTNEKVTKGHVFRVTSEGRAARRFGLKRTEGIVMMPTR